MMAKQTKLFYSRHSGPTINVIISIWLSLWMWNSIVDEIFILFALLFAFLSENVGLKLCLYKMKTTTTKDKQNKQTWSLTIHAIDFSTLNIIQDSTYGFPISLYPISMLCVNDWATAVSHFVTCEDATMKHQRPMLH